MSKPKFTVKGTHQDQYHTKKTVIVIHKEEPMLHLISPVTQQIYKNVKVNVKKLPRIE